MSKEEHYRQLLLDSHIKIGGGIAELPATFEELLPSLPDPVPLDDILLELRSNLSAHPQAMLGEVGLDRAARVPLDHRATHRKLSPFTIPLEHQLAIVTAQMDVAVELQRNISFHSVKSQKCTVDLLAQMKHRHGPQWSRISIDMHSCGLSVETWKEIEVRLFRYELIMHVKIMKQKLHAKFSEQINDSSVGSLPQNGNGRIKAVRRLSVCTAASPSLPAIHRGGGWTASRSTYPQHAFAHSPSLSRSPSELRIETGRK